MAIDQRHGLTLMVRLLMLLLHLLLEVGRISTTGSMLLLLLMLRVLHVMLHDGRVHRKLIKLRIGRGTGRHREQRYLLVLLHFMRRCTDIWILHLGLLWTVLCNRMESMRRWRLGRSERLLLSLGLRSHGRVHVERLLL